MPSSLSSRPASSALDWALDKSLLGYSRIGPRVRRSWWPADPAAGALAGRHVLVTGATGGLGLATAQGVAALGAVVHLTGRDGDRLERARSQVLAAHPSAGVETHVADVSDLAATADFARDFAARVPRLHALVHNAGVLRESRTSTSEGHELTVATHVLGPHVLTFGLADALAGGRVVLVSSGGAYSQRLAVEDPESARGAWSGAAAYARTKRMQLVLGELWARELREISVATMHPGWADTPGLGDALPGFGRLVGPVLRDAAQGADTAVWLTATRDHIGSGGFWHDRRRRATHYASVRRETPDEVERFWRWVRDITGVPSPS